LLIFACQDHARAAVGQVVAHLLARKPWIERHRNSASIHGPQVPHHKRQLAGREQRHAVAPLDAECLQGSRAITCAGIQFAVGEAAALIDQRLPLRMHVHRRPQLAEEMDALGHSASLQNCFSAPARIAAQWVAGQILCPRDAQPSGPTWEIYLIQPETALPPPSPEHGLSFPRIKGQNGPRPRPTSLASCLP
jgi:hypothetical protein